MRRHIHQSFVVFACLMAAAPNAWAEITLGPSPPRHIWPISKQDVPTRHVSGTFGPRLQFSTTYDFHRGIDIPAPYGTPIHAVADGVVRIAGSSPVYTNPLIQLKHYKPRSKGSCESGGCYYTNYLHISAATVSVGQAVKRGNIIGYTGKSAAGFAHLHFEVRDGGLYAMHCIHPLAILPLDHASAPEITITHVGPSSSPGSVVVTGKVAVHRDELDLNRVEVEVYDTSSGYRVLTDSFAYDFNEWNRLFSPTDDPDRYLGDPNFRNVTVTPSVFKPGTTQYQIAFSFTSLAGPSDPTDVAVRMRAIDLDDQAGYDESP